MVAVRLVVVIVVVEVMVVGCSSMVGVEVW